MATLSTGTPANTSPRLAHVVNERDRLVADWNATCEAGADMDDDEFNRRGDEVRDLEYEAFAFPAASVADLALKMRAAAQYLEPGGKDDPDYGGMLDVRAWRGLLADVERLAGSLGAQSSTGGRV